MCVQVEEVYYHKQWQDLPILQEAPEPFKDKLHAIFYVNSNCKPKNQRREIMHRLQELIKETNSNLQVHSFGTCDRNMGEKERQEQEKLGKRKYGRRYKFCVVCASAVILAHSTSGMRALQSASILLQMTSTHFGM
jgi:hypothetical protein